MAQQTAVEWLIDKISIYIHDEVRSNPLIEQAKQMEKEQMRKCSSFWRGKENEIEKPIFEEYYNETFKK